MLWLARQADARIVAALPGAAVKVTTVPSPADLIGTREVRHHGVNFAYAGIVLLAVLAWLIYFVVRR